MEPIAAQRYNESQRMEIRTLVRLASEAISYYWPMRTFVHHNPLHGLEDMPFDEGVSKGRQLLGGRGGDFGELRAGLGLRFEIFDRDVDRNSAIPIDCDRAVGELGDHRRPVYAFHA